jgi:hypothetical protein
MFDNLKRKFKETMAEALADKLIKSNPTELRKMFEESANAQMKKGKTGMLFTDIIDNVERVTHVVEEESRNKLYLPVEFYADTSKDLYYLIELRTRKVVAFGQLDGKSPEETINKDLKGFCMYYNATMAFVLNDKGVLDTIFSDEKMFNVLKYEMYNIGWNYNVGPITAKIKEHTAI